MQRREQTPHGSNRVRNILNIPRWRTTRYAVALALVSALLLFIWPELARNLFETGFDSQMFMPHGVCYYWVPQLWLLHFSSDLLIGASYVAISGTLAYLVHRARRDIPFHWVFLAFGLFIIACGATHFMEVWTIWHATYWLSGYVKLVTAAASVATALVLPPLVPKTLALVRSAKLSEERRLHLERANEELETLREREREHLQAQLQASQARFNRLVESSIIGIILADVTGYISEANDAFLDMVGYTRADLAGGKLRWDAMTPPEQLYLDAQKIEEARTNGVCTPWEKEYIRLDGSRIPVLVGFTLLEESQGDTVGFVLDLTARRQAESEREALLAREQEARRAAENANRIKDEFLATLSHELRTPMTSILGWSSMLNTMEFDDATRAGALTTIERNARAQVQLIDDLLDVSRIITGNLLLNISPVDLVAIINAAIEAARPAVNAKSLRIETSLDATAGLVAGDAHRLQQTIWNLLSNAVKFTPEGGRIEIHLARLGAGIQFVVSDTGIGINHDFLPHVFDRFRQSDSSITRAHGGLGLGLAIVHHIVELHGGTIRAESRGEGLGAAFTVYLPATAGTSHTKESDWLKPADNDDASLQSSDNLAGVRVLVVDDEADTREMLAAMLAACGAQVTTAASAVEALEQIERERPDVLLSDIGMPEEDGFALIEKVRRLPPERGGKIPAVALTAYVGAEDRARTLRAGFQVHVAKPVEAAELIPVVAKLAGWTGNS